jgi:hypothetical protein
MKDHPWIKGPPFETPFEEQVWFNCVYATCMQQWASLEDGLAMAFFPIFGRPRFAARAVFYSTQGLRTKLTITDSAFTAFARNSELFDCWSSIKRRLENSINDRNKVTHGQKIGISGENVGKNSKITQPIFAVSQYLNGKSFDIFGAEIEQMRLRAAKVREDLEAIGCVVGSLTAPEVPSWGHISREKAFERLRLDPTNLPPINESMILDSVLGGEVGE